MKKLFIAILWIISVFLFVASFGVFLTGEITIAIILLAIGVFLLPPVLNKLFGKKKKEPSIELQQQVKDEKGSNDLFDKLDDAKDLDERQRIMDEELKIIKEGNKKWQEEFTIQRQGVQILETLNILSTTKNIDTLKGRYEFINQLYDDHIKASHNKRFLSDMQKSIDQYKSTYYERIPNDYEISLLIKPDKKNLQDFYMKSIIQCFERFLNEQIKQIESLKKQDAKNRRLEKIRIVHADAVKEITDKGRGLDEEKINEFITGIDNPFFDYFNNLIKQKNPGTN